MHTGDLKIQKDLLPGLLKLSIMYDIEMLESACIKSLELRYSWCGLFVLFPGILSCYPVTFQQFFWDV